MMKPQKCINYTEEKIMKGIAKELISYVEKFKAKGFPIFPLIGGQIELLSDHPEELIQWLQYLIASGHDFEYTLQQVLAKLDEEQWPPLIEFSADLHAKDPENTMAELVLYEAQHYSFLPVKYKHLKLNGYSQRQVDNSVTHAWAISFQVNTKLHKNHKEIVDYGYWREDGMGMPYKDDKGNYHWDKKLEIGEADNRSYHRGTDGQVIEHLFGGYISGLEATRINRLITLDPIPPQLPITGLKTLTLGMDFDKVFHTPIETRKPAYYQHDENGIPHVALNDIDHKKISFYRSAPIHSGKVLLYELPKKYLHHDTGNNWRIGGSPYWWQKPEIPTCIKCNLQMAFLANLPSGEMITVDENSACYGSADGTAYAWWCDDDKISCYNWQCT